MIENDWKGGQDDEEPLENKKWWWVLLVCAGVFIMALGVIMVRNTPNYPASETREESKPPEKPCTIKQWFRHKDEAFVWWMCLDKTP